MKAFVEIKPEDFASQISNFEEIIPFIVELDKQLMDAEFTEDLIKELVKSLFVDYTKEELNTFLEGMKR